MVEFLATVCAALILLLTSAISAAIMYAVLRLFGLTDFVADMIYSIKETAREIWHMITKE